jgi:hypothetical protein
MKARRGRPDAAHGLLPTENLWVCPIDVRGREKRVGTRGAGARAPVEGGNAHSLLGRPTLLLGVSGCEWWEYGPMAPPPPPACVQIRAPSSAVHRQG